MISTTVKAKDPAEFEPLELGAADNLFLVPFGKPGVGKTRLMATAPGLGVLPLHRKTRPTVEQVMKSLYPDRTVYWPKNADEFFKYKNPMEMSMMGFEESKNFHRQLVDKIKKAAWSLLEHPKIKTIGIDDGTTLYNLILFAHYGKSSRFARDPNVAKMLYGPPNDEFREFIVSLQAKHLVMPFQAGEAYVGNVAQGFDEPKGFKSIGFECNALVESKYSPEEGFWIDVRMCQDRAALQGEQGQKLLMNEMVEFKYLALELRPDSDISDWEE